VCFVVNGMFFIFAQDFLRNLGKFDFSAVGCFFSFLVVDGETEVEKHDSRAFDKTQFQTHFSSGSYQNSTRFKFTKHTALWLPLNLIRNHNAKRHLIR